MYSVTREWYLENGSLLWLVQTVFALLFTQLRFSIVSLSFRLLFTVAGVEAKFSRSLQTLLYLPATIFSAVSILLSKGGTFTEI